MDTLDGYLTVDLDRFEDDDDEVKVVEGTESQNNKIFQNFSSLPVWSSSFSPDYTLTGSAGSSGSGSPDSASFDESLDNMHLTNNNITVTGPSGSDNETWILPIYMQFNEGHKMAIIVYSILMVISAVGNITVLVTIVRFRMKARLNRVNLFLLHLAIADLLVTFLLMPLEISWHFTVSWRGGDFACRIMSFFRIFGLYLSGFLLVCISLDRYFAVLKPLALPEANKRGRIMLYIAWTASLICSLPQAWIFHVERHPKAQWYEQCVTYNFFSSPATELAYSVSGFILLYGFPLTMIISCYSCILYEIFKINNVNRGTDLRRSNMGALGRAKIRTLKMTVMIVMAFFCCWTPYNIMSLWYWIDRESAMQLDQRIQKGFFLFACTNSAVNPMVYGFFHIRTKKPATPVGSNNCRLQRLDIDKGPYKVRVRWRPRAECLCATSSSQMNSSSTGVGRIGMRPMYEVNGRQIYFHGQTMSSRGALTPTQQLNLSNHNLHNVSHLCGHYNHHHNHKNSPNQNNKSNSRVNNINPPRKSRRVKFVNLKNGALPFSPDALLFSTPQIKIANGPGSGPSGGGSGTGTGAGKGAGNASGASSDSGRATGSAPALALLDPKMSSIHRLGHKAGSGGFSRKSSSSYHSIPNSNQANSESGESLSHSHSLCHSQSHSGLTGELDDIDMDSNVGIDNDHDHDPQKEHDADHLCCRGVTCRTCHQSQGQARSLSPTSPMSSGLQYFSTHEEQFHSTSFIVDKGPL